MVRPIRPIIRPGSEAERQMVEAVRSMNWTVNDAVYYEWIRRHGEIARVIAVSESGEPVVMRHGDPQILRAGDVPQRVGRFERRWWGWRLAPNGKRDAIVYATEKRA